MIAMLSDKPAAGCGPDTEEILADLKEGDLLRLEPGERLWKLYCFRVPGHSTGLRHRIYTKIKTDGRLAMVTFVIHNPAAAEGGNGRRRPAARSNLARVPDLGPADLERIIAAIRQAQAAPEVCEELDLSGIGALDEQLARLAAIG